MRRKKRMRGRRNEGGRDRGGDEGGREGQRGSRGINSYVDSDKEIPKLMSF